MRARRWRLGVVVVLAAMLGGQPSILAQAPMPPETGVVLPRLAEDDIREWLTYLSSDLLQGRGVFTEGFGLAASYIAEQLRTLGVEPFGPDGSYFQPLTRTTYRATMDSSVSLTVGGERRTFEHGDHVTFRSDAGAAQTVAFTRLVFAGAGPVPGQSTPLGVDLTDALVLYMPDLSAPDVPRGRNQEALVTSRSTQLVRTYGAAAVVALSSGRPRGRGQGNGGNGQERTVESLDEVTPPLLVADETFFEFILGDGPMSFDALQAMARSGDSLPVFEIGDASGSITIDNSYEVVATDLTQNVVGLIEGADPALRDTYVFFGAHLDHVGYADESRPRGQVNVPLEEDRIWNGADDDGSGSAALLAIAQAFLQGPPPRRSVVFVWHAGEEQGLLGSEFMAAHPVVPLDRIQAQLNVDMIGRNRDDDPDESNTLYLIGADRISTDLHNLIVDVNEAQLRPLTLDYEFNDPTDTNRFYVRSDHFSYASRGVPIAFFFTGTHPDYHANTDSVDKILFPKLTRIAQLIYETGLRIADTAEPLRRDFRGARSGRGFEGRLE